jgi:hypothetical protein
MKTDKRTTTKIPAPGRDTSGRFLKGATGNPGGRPVEDSEVRALARAHGPAAVARLACLMHSDDPATCIAASKALLDRGFGKPTQSIEMDANIGPKRVCPAMRDMNVHDATQAYLDHINAAEGEVEFLPPQKTEAEYAMDRFKELMGIEEPSPKLPQEPISTNPPQVAKKMLERPSPVAPVSRAEKTLTPEPLPPRAAPRSLAVVPETPIDPDDRVISVVERQDMELRSQHVHKPMPDSWCAQCRQLWVIS